MNDVLTSIEAIFKYCCPLLNMTLLLFLDTKDAGLMAGSLLLESAKIQESLSIT